MKKFIYLVALFATSFLMWNCREVEELSNPPEELQIATASFNKISDSSKNEMQTQNDLINIENPDLEETEPPKDKIKW